MAAVLSPATEELIRRLDVPAPRYTSYPTVPMWSETFGPASGLAALGRAAKAPEAPLGLYVHIPFCKSRCSFCGCNVIVSRSREKADRYLDYLEKELDLVSAQLGARRNVSQLHWGGGTPTFLDIEQIERLHGMLTDRFDFLPGAERSLELDPKVTTPEQIETLARLGFNRLSMGVQDFDPYVQEGIRRIQTFKATHDAVIHAREVGFTSINFDLIYGLPRQTEQTWAETIDKVVALSPDRLAIYGFAFVPQAKPHQKSLPIAELPTPMDKHRLFRLAHARLAKSGYEAIGMDHFARSDDELCRAKHERRLGRNFQGYTVHAAPETVAVGLTAISDVGGAYVQNEAHLGRYERALDAGQLPVVRGMNRSADDDERRHIIHELMCHGRVNLGPDADRRFAKEIAELDELMSLGLVAKEGTELVLSPEGELFVRNVAKVFDAYLGTREQVMSRAV